MGLGDFMNKEHLFQVGAGNCRKCDGIVIMYNWQGWELAKCPHCGNQGGVTTVVKNLTVRFVDLEHRYSPSY